MAHRVTRILPRKRTSKVAVVEFEDHDPVEVLVESLEAAGIRENTVVSPEALTALLGDDLRRRCRDSAWRLLAHRPRSRAELIRALRQRRFPGALVEETVDDLERRGYLDDGAFANLFAEEQARRRVGPRGIEQKLKSRGIERGMAESAARGAASSGQTRENARTLLVRWNRRSTPTDHRKRVQSAASFLLRRGYDSDLVWELVREIIGERPAE